MLKPLLPLFLLLMLTVSQAAERKNVLFIISDDLNCYLSSYGHPLAKTPNLDALAERGTRFDRAYCQYPVCNASRASIFTGLRPDVTDVKENWTHFRHHIPDCHTLPQWFKEKGYFSARVGKIYHYNVPKEIGMDCMDDPASWTIRYNPYGRDKREEAQITTLTPGRYGATLSWMASEGKDEEQTDAIGATAANKILEHYCQGEQPFFLAFGMFRPHTPYVAPKAYFDMYPRDQIEIDETYKSTWEQIPSSALLSMHDDERELTAERKREIIQAYLASITFMDAQVGRVLEKLDELRMTDSTLIVFTSDHGYHMNEHGLWQKMSLFEESTRVPLFIAAPGQETPGGVVNDPVELIDLFPTICEWAGVGLPDTFERDGQSLLPMLADPTTPSKGYAISQLRRAPAKMKHTWFGAEPGPDAPFHGYSIRTAQYRYNRWDEGRMGEELYDHSKDPAEMNNLANNPEYETIKSELKAQLAPFEQAHGEPDAMDSRNLLRLK